MKQTSFLKINPADSVVVCLQAIPAGTLLEIDGKSITLLQDTPAGHKVAINDMKEGEDIIKYGYPIGHALKDLKAGEWINEDNLKTNLSGKLEYTYSPVNEKLTIPTEDRTFNYFSTTYFSTIFQLFIIIIIIFQFYFQIILKK